MGRNIARVLLRGGAEVNLFSRTEQTLLDASHALNGESHERVSYGTSIAGSCMDAELIIESVPESLALKLEVLKQAERAAPPEAVVATDTSSLPLAALASKLARPERFLGLHWFNPAHLIPLVEVVAVPQTAAAVVAWATDYLAGIGKRPLVLPRPIPGFLANRLQYALIREALALVQDGVATPEQIDAVMTDCLGLRWAVLGPMRSTDLAGVGTAVAVARQLFPELSDADAPQQPLTSLLQAGRLGVASGEGFYSYDDGESVAEARDRLLCTVLGALAEARCT
jgi:3-hydroxybutyryl-CoA dehydrogenase